MLKLLEHCIQQISGESLRNKAYFPKYILSGVDLKAIAKKEMSNFEKHISY